MAGPATRRGAVLALAAALGALALAACGPGAGAPADGTDAPASGAGAPAAVDSAAEVQAVERVVEAFHAALASGDSATALGLLSPDVRVLEGGGVETLEEYRAHHLPADMAFARAVPRERDPATVRIVGDVAWVSSTSRARGTYRDREIDARGAELIVLRRHPDGWRVEAVHWSSR